MAVHRGGVAELNCQPQSLSQLLHSIDTPAAKGVLSNLNDGVAVMCTPATYQTWTKCPVDSFVFKAQQNLLFAEKARAESRFDVEANRVYYALHQLACELVRLKKMIVHTPGRRATATEPWRIDHGSYSQEIRQALGVAGGDADQVISKWHSFRMRADYDPEQVCLSAQWKQGIAKRRDEAFRVAQVIYEKINA